MNKKNRAIINKINFIIKMESWNELQKMEKYLGYEFSCAHCKYWGDPVRKCSLPHIERKNNRFTPSMNGIHWCVGWIKPGNWVNKKKKVQ